MHFLWGQYNTMGFGAFLTKTIIYTTVWGLTWFFPSVRVFMLWEFPLGLLEWVAACVHRCHDSCSVCCGGIGQLCFWHIFKHNMIMRHGVRQRICLCGTQSHTLGIRKYWFNMHYCTEGEVHYFPVLLTEYKSLPRTAGPEVRMVVLSILHGTAAVAWTIVHKTDINTD